MLIYFRYQYDTNIPSACSQIRITSTRDLNLNVSVSNINTIFQAYSSWNNFSHIDESYKKRVSRIPSYALIFIIDMYLAANKGLSVLYDTKAMPAGGMGPCQ